MGVSADQHCHMPHTRENYQNTDQNAVHQAHAMILILVPYLKEQI